MLLSHSLFPCAGDDGGGDSVGKPRAVRAQLRQEVPQELHHGVYLGPGQKRTECSKRLENLLSISLQEEECDEVFRKICYIEMVDFAQNVSTEVCRRPLVKDCDLPGEEVCRTEYQSECWSKRIPHEVRKSQIQRPFVRLGMCQHHCPQSKNSPKSQMCHEY